MLELLEARVTKPANGGVRLYVLLRGTREEVIGDAGLAMAEEAAKARGWAHDGRAEAGWPMAYGLRTVERWFAFEQCACHHKYACERLTRNIVWGGGFSGQEADPMGTLL